LRALAVEGVSTRGGVEILQLLLRTTRLFQQPMHHMARIEDDIKRESMEMMLPQDGGGLFIPTQG
jgi:hypothetical protein